MYTLGLQSSPTPPSTLDEIGTHFTMSSEERTMLLSLFMEKSRKTKIGSNIAIMLDSIRVMRKTNPTFFTLNMNRVSSFVAMLSHNGVIEPRKYPAKRKGASVDGRRRLYPKAVVRILSTDKENFIDSVRKTGSIERGYTNFARDFNKRSKKEYFPVDWDLLREPVRIRIKEILGVTSPTMKVTDIPTIRFATKDEIMAHPYFRSFFAQALIRMKQDGLSFHVALPIILNGWNSLYSFSGLRVPTSLNKVKGKTTFESVIGAPDVKIESILGALGLDKNIWSTMILPPELAKELPRASIFQL